MIILSDKNINKDFDEICNRVIDESKAITITRFKGRNIVMIPESEYNNLIENLRLLSNPVLKSKVVKGIDQIEKSFSKKVNE